jgi:hypothetical protein
MRAALAAAPMVMAAVLAVGMHDAQAQVVSHGPAWTGGFGTLYSGGKQYSDDNEVGKAANAYESLRSSMYGFSTGAVIGKAVGDAQREADEESAKPRTEEGQKSTYGQVSAASKVGSGWSMPDYTKPYRPGSR